MTVNDTNVWEPILSVATAVNGDTLKLDVLWLLVVRQDAHTVLAVIGQRYISVW